MGLVSVVLTFGPSDRSKLRGPSYLRRRSAPYCVRPFFRIRKAHAGPGSVRVTLGDESSQGLCLNTELEVPYDDWRAGQTGNAIRTLEIEAEMNESQARDLLELAGYLSESSTKSSSRRSPKRRPRSGTAQAPIPLMRDHQ